MRSVLGSPFYSSGCVSMPILSLLLRLQFVIVVCLGQEGRGGSLGLAFVRSVTSRSRVRVLAGNANLGQAIYIHLPSSIIWVAYQATSL